MGVVITNWLHFTLWGTTALLHQRAVTFSALLHFVIAGLKEMARSNDNGPYRPVN
jgi:hypothetical protein